MVNIREAGARDRAAVATMLGRAFADDPAMSYIFPDAADRAKRLQRLFGLLFDSDGVGMRLVSQDADAGTFWRPPGQAHVPTMAFARRLIPVLHALGASLPRAMRLGDAVEAHFPSEPFWYLHIAGVDPARQGRGLGGASIRAGLARCDADGVPAYLETATESNVGLYARLGFELTGEWSVPKGGPRFWSMMRPVGA
ncbi:MULTISPECIES: GNAT family N-acetyltransferase [Sphingomonas]|uniref:GNAT family N-acetyltransferase n=2 Tax=Sphingomonas zeae TaxID=1646122 RepID=A0A7Y6B6Z2_9SPHN|nr:MULTISPECIES: GNAT family N-acetyltransferase [Sphingomonas]MBB4047422.1 ribosomal protein S18 acetylase RimI-like enzyme [Sphingomonas zeae]MDK8214840.1 GNAT family N-acetyltransferase [Sphingomonas sp. UMB7805-LC452B]NUU48566.1 GNAT family N-acetyltransferase [Sphingomonas zeae]